MLFSPSYSAHSVFSVHLVRSGRTREWECFPFVFVTSWVLYFLTSIHSAISNSLTILAELFLLEASIVFPGTQVLKSHLSFKAPGFPQSLGGLVAL